MATVNTSNVSYPFATDVTNSANSQEFEDFIYLLSHDIRNSLRALLEVPHWIEEDLREANQTINTSLRENLDLMKTHSRRLDRILSDMLVYSRVGRKQTLETIDLNGALDTILDQVNIPPEISVRRDLQAKTLHMGDKDAMTLLNALISNAIKHRDEGTTEVVIACAQENGKNVLRISDNGPGIPMKYRGRVFEAITTLKPRDVVEGSGMGLTIVRKIVELYRGTINLTSGEDDRGLVIEMAFPD